MVIKVVFFRASLVIRAFERSRCPWVCWPVVSCYVVLQRGRYNLTVALCPPVPLFVPPVYIMGTPICYL